MVRFWGKRYGMKLKFSDHVNHEEVDSMGRCMQRAQYPICHLAEYENICIVDLKFIYKEEQL